MKIIRQSSYGVAVSYCRAFYFNNRRSWGASFPCDENGTLYPLEYQEARDNLAQCLTGKQADGTPIIDAGIEMREHAWKECAIGECNHCRKHVYLDSFTNTCDCGADYNSAGQELAPRSQWGEETGEHWSECI